jgi:tRNA-specific 2-thiouridylase
MFQLLAGKDPNKDQSYFLWTLTQKQLSKTLFPVGDMEKPVVRALAQKFKLPNAGKKDSQGLCFIGKIDVKEFLSHYIPIQKGKVLDQAGTVIGTHDGAVFYTIGERHGFTITKKTPTDEPVYVVAKDVEVNTLTVSKKQPDGSLATALSTAVLEQINWNQGFIPLDAPLLARSRYREELQDIRASDNTTIHFVKPQSTLSTGQSIVVYSGDICLGGGIISGK